MLELPEDALRLLKGMLTLDPNERISAKEALKIKWLNSLEETKVSLEEQKISLEKLKKFRSQTALQRVVLTYFATLQMLPQEEEELRKTFALFDQDHDGIISIADLVKGYEKIYEDKGRAKLIAEKIMAKIDLNNNGSIDFTGI